jgi:uncharacterized protein (DUF302 family)
MRHAGPEPVVVDRVLPQRRPNVVATERQELLMVERSSVVTKRSGRSVAETVDAITSVMTARGFSLFRVIDHRDTAERAGVPMPDSQLIMFGNPAKGAAVMVASPPAGLDLPLKILVWADASGVVSVSYNAPEFMAERHGLDGDLRAPFDAIESIVAAALAP